MTGTAHTRQTDGDGDPIAAILVHVADVEAGLVWYRKAFPQAAPHRTEDGFSCLAIGLVQLEIVPADDKVGSGASGSVVYWRVENVDSAFVHMRNIGATLYRGPLAIEDGLRMCQVRDPWGNCIGLRGR